MSQVEFDAYAAEIRRLAETSTYLQINMPVIDLFAVIGALQLALRHPHFPATNKVLLTEWIVQVAEQMPSDVLREHIYQGFDERFDV